MSSSPHATRQQSTAVFAGGLVQGIALVTFPAAAGVFMSSGAYDLSSVQYGAMFVPQVVTAIVASAVGGRLTSRFGIKRVYLAGLVADLAAMLALLVSAALEHDRPAAYPVLLLATGLLGAGFGLTVPSLNTLAATLQPTAVDRAVLALNALLGLGTALAPVIGAVFVGAGFWWGLPAVVGVLLVALLAVVLRVPLPSASGAPNRTAAATGLPKRFAFFAGTAVLYGVIETMSGNWSQTVVLGQVRGSALQASLALAAFWASVTVGRVLFALVPARATRSVYRLLPYVVALAFAAVAFAPAGAGALGIAAFSIAGLGCSALLPLTVSFAEEQFSQQRAIASTGVIAFYQVGYGIAAFGVGPLRAAGIPLSGLFAVAAIVAVATGFIAIPVTRRTAAD